MKFCSVCEISLGVKNTSGLCRAHFMKTLSRCGSENTAYRHGRHMVNRVFAERYGAKPPWACHFCGGRISTEGRGPLDLNRHHLDGDNTNNAPDNLAPAHGWCHIRSHRRNEVLR